MLTVEISGTRGEGKSTLAILIARMLVRPDLKISVDDQGHDWREEIFADDDPSNVYRLIGEIAIKTRHIPSAKDGDRKSPEALSSELLNTLAPILDLPLDCCGIHLSVDLDGGPPRLEVQRLLVDTVRDRKAK